MEVASSGVATVPAVSARWASSMVAFERRCGAALHAQEGGWTPPTTSITEPLFPYGVPILSSSLVLVVQVMIDRGRIDEPSSCHLCGNTMSMELVHNRCLFTDKQMIRLQVRPISFSCDTIRYNLAIVGKKERSKEGRKEGRQADGWIWVDGRQ